MELLQTQQKERQDMILEPLQVMIQLSLLSNCEIGTKVSVSDNLLHIQRPSVVQGALRWWKGDNKDDLYYLFHAIRRYYLWYKSKDTVIFNYILLSAINGLEKLIETYKLVKNTAITHTLSLYTNILKLENQELFESPNENAINMDKVFENIVNLYDKKELMVVFNILKKMEETTNNIYRDYYITALLSFLEPTHLEIRKWIQDKLTC
tara:strand:+ start:439 stop:1062 length:624 start_codon:yes stop_codon:yes gene_type:complete